MNAPRLSHQRHNDVLRVRLHLGIAFSGILAIIFLLTAKLAVACDVSSSLASSTISPIMSLLSSYGDTTSLQNNIDDNYSSITEPIIVETNDARIALREIVYDGLWLYTSADICAITPESVLVMPGSATIGDPCSGCNGERGIEDTRSFKDAAIEDGKRLLVIYVYPKEFDEIGEYFLDHYQHADGSFTFLSGAYMNTENSAASLTISIQVYEVDLLSGEYSFIEELVSNTQLIYPYTALEKKTYVSTNENAPFDSVQLLKSSLTTYIQPMLDGKPYEIFDFVCYLENDKEIPHGASLDIRSLALFEFPDEFILHIYGDNEYHLIQDTP